MKFCPKCGTWLRVKQARREDGAVALLFCERCNEYLEPVTGQVLRTEGEGSPSIKVVSEQEGSLKTMPTTAAECPKCGNRVAMWWMVQTRSGDEPPTQFMRCTSCGHTWRNYA